MQSLSLRCKLLHRSKAVLLLDSFVGRQVLEPDSAMFTRFVESSEPAQGLALLRTIDVADVTSYQPYWVAMAHLLRACADTGVASSALFHAIGLTADERVRAHLAKQDEAN